MPDYTTSFLSPATPERAYRVVAEQMPHWWTPTSAPFLAVGDTAKTGFDGQSYWVFRAKALIPQKLIELECIESFMVSEQVDTPREWEGSTLRFEFVEQPGGIRLTFTHIGLRPEMKCWNMCKRGWDHYLPGSLQNYLKNGAGKPNSF
ncbi:SRPBCC domain-containing protein [Microbulbifer sp. OS29]|uniref:SRPBCC domain-containing protein n=1 Tax=Microbulbifer okhotskensis TaxID=2926617 RepID=A0A9X2EQA4_9GAMM|nr:SRPBCC domain-containing protein [Microbulbifer okhotskensis]MCO1335375.1 SRPBCC domain-containing protein [Microbulbifer okhotskensis]